MVAMSGSFDVFLSDGNQEKTVHLNRSYEGLYIPRGIWHEFRNFSTNSLAMVLSSEHYDAAQYVRGIDKVKELQDNGEI